MEKVKLFLSYGRSDAYDVALRLKKDLESVGYDVWMDKSEIKAGSAWMKEIEKGLRESKAMLALLSPHSVRISGMDGSSSDSVCLDEIAFAREYPGKILPIMVADCNVPLILYRLHYIDLRLWQTSEEEYQRGFHAVIDGLIASFRNEIHYRSWQQNFQPWDFIPFLEERRKGFFGRHWLFEEVINWLEGDHEEHCLLIAGDPGIGKSAFVAQWIHLNPNGRLLAYHCCQIDNELTLLPHNFIRNIAAMIASQIPDFENILQETNVAEALREDKCREDPIGSFDTGILSPLLRIKPPVDGVKCILIDALDEAILLKNSKTIVDILVDRLDRLPNWLRIVATSRKEPEILRKLDRLRAKKVEAHDSRNLKDAKEFLQSHFKEPIFAKLLLETKISLESAVEILFERSKGNFLYIHYAMEGLLLGNYHLNRPDEFPPGLPGFYEKTFRSRFISEQEYAPAAGVLAIVMASREPIDYNLLSVASNIFSSRELNSILKKLAIYLPEREGTYSLFHRSLGEWLRDSRNNESYCIETVQGERMLADAGWNEYLQKGSDLTSYMQRNLPFHLSAIGQWEKLSTLLTDFSILDNAWKDGREYEWMYFWCQMIDKVDMVQEYQKSIQQFILTGADEYEISSVTRKVGILLRDMGLYGVALPFAKEALSILQKNSIYDSAELASCYFDLAETCRLLKDFDQAEGYYLEALRIREQLFEPDSSEIGEIAYKLCVFYNTCNNRDIDKAILYNEKAIKIREKLNPPDYAALADAVNDKGILLDAKGEQEKSLPYYMRAKELFEKGFPGGHPELGVVLTNIGNYYATHNDYENSVILYLKGLQMRSLFVVHYDSKCQGFRRRLRYLYLKMGDRNESLKWAKEILFHDRSNTEYDVEKRKDDLHWLAIIAAGSSNMPERDKAIRQLIEEIRKQPIEIGLKGWQTYAELYINLINIEISKENFNSIPLLFESAVKILNSLSQKPYEALEYLFKEMSLIAGELKWDDISVSFASKAEVYKFMADYRTPFLLNLLTVNELLSDNLFEEAKQLAEDVFMNAPEIPSSDQNWKTELASKANDFALKSKNEKNNFDLAEWFYLQGIAINANDSLLLGNYAFFLTSVRGKHEEAAVYYQQALDINPNDANCLSNYAVFYTNVKYDFDKAEELFAKAVSFESIHNGAIWGNYAALQIIRGNLNGAMNFSALSREACLNSTDRLLARPLFCAAAIAALSNENMTLYLAQIKSLFLSGIQYAPWQANALIDHLKSKLEREVFELLEFVWKSICSKDVELELEKLEVWNQIRPIPIDKPWSS